ncbi:MAG TPA: hypothetical protein VMW26_01990 [Methanomassiliicoccales archaeon]|nr:hypothetical protein [Methanomassiliicoccales archaeon]
MVELPEVVAKAINDPKAFKVVTTISPEGDLHAIQVGACVSPEPEIIAVGAILMQHTSKNMESMQKKGQAVAIAIGKEMESYQVMAKVQVYQTEGPLYDAMSENIKKLGLQLRGVWILEPIEVWNQSATYEAGKRMV